MVPGSANPESQTVHPTRSRQAAAKRATGLEQERAWEWELESEVESELRLELDLELELELELDSELDQERVPELERADRTRSSPAAAPAAAAACRERAALRAQPHRYPPENRFPEGRRSGAAELKRLLA